MFELVEQATFSKSMAIMPSSIHWTEQVGNDTVWKHERLKFGSVDPLMTIVKLKELEDNLLVEVILICCVKYLSLIEFCPTIRPYGSI